MTTTTLRMRNGCMKIDDNNFIIPGLMKINSEEGVNNGMYLQANSGPLIDGNGYSTVNIVAIDPNGNLLENIIESIIFTPANTTLPGQQCPGNPGEIISPIYFEYCGSNKGSAIGSPTCDVIISNPNIANPITTYIPTFAESLSEIDGSRKLILWDSLESKFIDFVGFPLDPNVGIVHSHSFEDEGIYRFSYDSDLTSIKEIFRTEISQPRNMATEVNDMATAFQTNPQPSCDLLPSGV